MSTFNPDYCVAPGETILEVMEDRGITIKELASYLLQTAEEVQLLLVGESPLTESIAAKLEELFDIPQSFWLNLERFYQEKKKELLSNGE